MAQHPPLKRYVPLLAWLPRYRRNWLRIDALAGITAWGTTVPTAMGFAYLAGLPVRAGLYAAMVALFAYAVLGTSKVLKVETSPSMAVMSAAVVAPLALGDFAYYVTLDAKGVTRSRLEHTGLLERIGEKNLYLRVPEAVEDVTEYELKRRPR